MLMFGFLLLILFFISGVAVGLKLVVAAFIIIYRLKIIRDKEFLAESIARSKIPSPRALSFSTIHKTERTPSGRYYVKTPNRKKTYTEKLKILNRTNSHCFYCNKELNYESMQIDHVWPRVLGGVDDFINLVPSCTSCNKYKGWGSPFNFIYGKWKNNRKITDYERNFIQFYSTHSPLELTTRNIDLSDYFESIRVFNSVMVNYHSYDSIPESIVNSLIDKLDFIDTNLWGWEKTSYEEPSYKVWVNANGKWYKLWNR
jgi:5-methylcytosine-specific restriction endonuclease McrA